MGVKFQVGDRVIGRWKTTDGSRPVQGWCGEVRKVMDSGNLLVAFPPYGKNELTRICKPEDLEMQP